MQFSVYKYPTISKIKIKYYPHDMEQDGYF